jgi:hypothetical protein
VCVGGGGQQQQQQQGQAHARALCLGWMRFSGTSARWLTSTGLQAVSQLFHHVLVEGKRRAQAQEVDVGEQICWHVPCRLVA